MMKKIIFLGLMIASLSACSTLQHKDTAPAKVGVANPASEYCISQGGKLEIQDEVNGQVGYCDLPDGQMVEEWKLFRDSQKECLPEKAKDLIGQSSTLTDDQIKQKTQSELIRRVAPDQPVTMDYRSNRITVTIDPVSKKIMQASCG